MELPARKHELTALYKYCVPETAKKVLRAGTFRWSSPALFNDPFDVPRTADFEYDSRSVADAVVAELERVVGGTDLPRDPTVAEVVRILRSGPPEHVRAAMIGPLHREMQATLGRIDPVAEFKKAYVGIVPTLRILCLSEVPDSPVMWAHYASNGTGVALRFAALDEIDSVLRLAQRISYQAERPSLPGCDVLARAIVMGEEVDWHDFLGEYYYSKSSDWQYEKELRVLTYDTSDSGSQYSDIHFHPRDLTGVVLGPRMSEDDEREIRSLLHGQLAHVEVLRACSNLMARRIDIVTALPARGG